MVQVESLACEGYEAFAAAHRQMSYTEASVFAHKAVTLLKGDQHRFPDEEMFVDAFMEMAEYIDAPEKLFEKAQEKIWQLIAGRDGYLTDDQVRFFAANLCAPDIDQLRELTKDPAITWDGYPESDIDHATQFKLPNPWYLDLLQYPKPVHVYNRQDFIQPSSMDMWKWVETLTTEIIPVVVLDAGTGSGMRPKLLKDLFGDKIWTVGLGLENQAMPVDENIVQPMEILPLNWTDRFDVVMSNYALGYATYPIVAIKELLRVLAPGKTAFLDIRSFYVVNGPVHWKIIADLLGISEADYWRIAKEAYVGLNGYKAIKATVEGWSTADQQFTVDQAQAGDSSGYCVEVTKS